jgi:hypothetical protein
MSKNVFALLAATGLATAAPVSAQDPEAGPILDAAGEQQSDAPFNLDAAKILSDDDLGLLRGGEVLVVTDQTLLAVTSGNVINGDYAAGSISLSDFSLSNFTGVGNLMFNSGAQNSLQSGINLTINVRP